ncbi:hypothetical protein [Desulfatibacillum aliphaticivorans]|uniref:LuxE/PaaK family acyltransferase n=1 Tax=Desulfatibacillum aliphaticivorans TaxID=218208 RepID=UPI000485FB35|nr:hypothetical protein [Desulfatibacillum aliphaticivorans]
MTAYPDQALKQAQDGLKKIMVQWAATKTCDQDKARTLREQAAAANYLRYRRSIPCFAKVCSMAGMNGDSPGLDQIIEHCMIPDDIFKSYPQGLLDDRDFQGMNRWLAKVGDIGPSQAAGKARNMDQWLDLLKKEGIHLVFSSGTSGNMSFVPRDENTWRHFLKNSLLYTPMTAADQGVIPSWKKLALKLLCQNMEPDALLSLTDRYGRLIFRDFDGYFCNFSGGAQGIQLVGQELAKYCRNAFFLYDAPLSPMAVRGIIRGATAPEEQAVIDAFLKTTVHDKKANYHRMLSALEKSSKRGRKAIIFGTPYLLLEICQEVKARKLNLRLKKGSAVFFGGGWKSFDGNRIPEEELLELIGESLGIERNFIAEGYSMTEIQGLMLRCPEGRYHIPPHFETVILDPGLRPLGGDDVTGTLGIIDPFAESYPGFLITGDHVRRVNEPCPCGRGGPAIISIARSPGREVKGCGGIMAKINA